MEHAQASELLGEVAELQRLARAAVGNWWVAMVVFGLVGVGAGAVTMVAPGRLLGGYWLGADIVALAVVTLSARRRSRAIGARLTFGRPLLAGAALGMLAFGAAVVTPAWLAPVAPWVVVIVAYVAMAFVAHLGELAVVAAVMALACAAALATGRPEGSADFACGLVLVAAGLHSRRRTPAWR